MTEGPSGLPEAKDGLEVSIVEVKAKGVPTSRDAFCFFSAFGTPRSVFLLRFPTHLRIALSHRHLRSVDLHALFLGRLRCRFFGRLQQQGVQLGA